MNTSAGWKSRLVVSWGGAWGGNCEEELTPTTTKRVELLQRVMVGKK